MALSNEKFNRLQKLIEARSGADISSLNTVSQKPGLPSRVSSTINDSGAKVYNAIIGQGENQGQGSIRRGFEAGAIAANTVAKVGMDTLPEPARDAMNWVGNKVGEGFSFITDKVAETNLFKEIGELEAQGFLTPEIAPELFKVKEALGIASASGQIAGDILATNQVTKGAQKIADVSKNTVKPVISNVVDKTGEVASKVKSVVGDSPESIMQRVARVSKGKQARFEQMSGESIGGYLTKRGIFGNIDDITTKLYERFIKSRNTADEAFSKLTGTYSPTPVKTALKELFDRETRVSSPGAQSPNLSRISDLLKKFDRQGLTMKEINEVKRLFEKNVKVDYLKSISSNPEGVVRATNLDSAIRKWQLEQAKTLGLKNLDIINNETRFAKQLLDDIGQEYAGAAGNNAMTITDWIMLSGGDVAAISGFLAKKGFSNKSVQSAIAKWLNKGKEVMGDVKADIGTSQVKQLPPGKTKVPIIESPINVKGKSTIDAAADSATRTTINPKTGDKYVRDLKTGKVTIVKRKKN